MALLTIEDLETASGTTIASGDEPRYQWYIDAVTAYIETYTGQSFSSVTDEVVLCRANRYGAIQFDSLSSVSKVEELDNWLGTYTEYTSGTYAFNGIDTVYGLNPFATYRLTIDYGWDAVPDDIQGIATDLVMAGSGLQPGASGGLSRYRVGDVEEVYGVTAGGDGSAIVTITSLQASVLDAHNSHTTTWRL